MKSFLPLAVAVLMMASCSTYKSGQTPDDVYYSPKRAQTSGDDYVRADRNDRKYRYNDEDSYEDEYLRMKVRNRNRWSALDNDMYFNNYYSYSSPYFYNNPFSYNRYAYSPFGYGLSLGLGYYNPYSYGSFYPMVSPYYSYGYGYPSSFGYYNYYYPYYGSGVGIGSSKTSNRTYSSPRTFNLNTYNRNSNTSNAGSTRSNRGYSNNEYVPSYNNNNRNSNAGNDLRSRFDMNNSSNNSYSSPSRSTGSYGGSSGGSGGSGSSSGNAPVRRF